MNLINFDNCVTRPMSCEVLEYYSELIRRYNGIKPSAYLNANDKSEIQEAREEMAKFINCEPGEIIFTSSGTEANNLAIKGAAGAYSKKGKHILTTPFEHSSILYPLKTLSKNGFSVDEIKFSYDIENQVLTFDPNYLNSLINDNTILLSAVYANLDAGIIIPAGNLCAAAKKSGVITHIDACSISGNLPIDVKKLNCDLLSISCHKFGGPPSVGVLYKKAGTRLFPQIEGGIEENGLRGGFYNIAAISAAGFAAKILGNKYNENRQKILKMKQMIFDNLSKSIKNINWISNLNPELYFYLSFCIPGVDNEFILKKLLDLNIVISALPICAIFAGKVPSSFEFIDINAQKAQNYFKICLSNENTIDEVKYFCEKFSGIINNKLS